MKFIDYVNDQLNEQNISRYSLALSLDVSQSTVHRWLNKEIPIKLKDYIAILKVLKIKEIKVDNTTFKL